ncbi:histidine phosphatase family protein [Pseudoduganella chitinolytica]|uniref:Histidine phosphatase family protein n=1 Tax=Pseudoduganella chitinolytica TaxID=34070 RepID=A0ABY8BGG6_9BURK|nr:histidine phosphatase family protein [Pseudoduganella chitinolytica]WEF34930.1 histidine phosphatase family protein [Pseudoduganella chitinolytica]
MQRRTLLGWFLVLCAGPTLAETPDELWRRLQAGGHVLVVRHAATEPGVGDPPGFTLNDCATQRNLSLPGREDARALGAAVRQHGVPVARVLSSRWCRCQDTARIAFGRVEPAPMLDSLMGDDPDGRGRKLAELRQALGVQAKQGAAAGNLVLVTHDVNIQALTGDKLAQGEMLVATIRPDGTLAVLGRLGVPKSADAVQAM